MEYGGLSRLFGMLHGSRERIGELFKSSIVEVRQILALGIDKRIAVEHRRMVLHDRDTHSDLNPRQGVHYTAAQSTVEGVESPNLLQVRAGHEPIAARPPERIEITCQPVIADQSDNLAQLNLVSDNKTTGGTASKFSAYSKIGTFDVPDLKATTAEPEPSALRLSSARQLADVLVMASERCPDGPSLVLNSMESYKGFCDGNAGTEHRLWKGPQDLSARIFVWKPQRENVHARVVVRDDKSVAFKDGKSRRGDHMRVVFNGEERRLPPSRTENGEYFYEFDLPWHAVPGPFTFEAYDDDGEGLDGYLGGDGYLLKFE